MPPRPIPFETLPDDIRHDLSTLSELAARMSDVADRLNRAGYAPVYGLWDWDRVGCTVSGMIQGNTSRIVLYRMTDRGRG